MKRKLLSLGLILLVTIMMLGILFSLPAFVRAGTLCVNPGGTDGCYSSIQSAINAAADGDTVRVAQGTYLEAITITKSITLAGGWKSNFNARDWDVYVSTIDAQRTGSVIVIPTGVTVTVEGFTITGGDASGHLGWGGGIRIGESFNNAGYSIIRYNVITNNIACTNDGCQGEGGGIHVYNNTALIEKNEIISNTARSGGTHGGKGGGAALGWQSSVTMFSNLVQSNTAVITPTGLWSGNGGGIYASSYNILLRENYVIGNTAAVTGTGRGGGIYLYGDAISNYVENNVAGKYGIGYGGGIYADYLTNGQYNTIINNRASDTGTGYGGGVYAYQIGTFSKNYVQDNTADSGGGIYLDTFSSAKIISNEFSGNQSTGNTGSGFTADGGGAIFSRDKNAVIQYNTVFSNSAALYGGGIFFASAEKSTVDHNEISENSALLGGGIAVYTTTVNINHNTITGNTSVMGGGVFLNGRSQSTLDANTISHNSASGFFSAAGGGVAVYVEADVPVTMTNNMIAKNAAESGTGAGLWSINGAMRVLNNTFVDNNTGTQQEGLSIYDAGGTYSDEIWNNIVVGHSTGILVNAGVPFIVKSGFWNNTTNISGGSDLFEIIADPRFVDRPGEDYHLQSTSPIIDQGSDNWTKVDFDGDARTHGVHDDIGADEVYASETYVSVDIGNDTTGDGTSGTPFATVTKAINETTVGGTVYVGRGTYAECVGIPHSLKLRGGYNEAAGWTRDIAANETTIDGYDTCAVVTVSNFDTDMTLEGFTITRGYTGWGAGVNVSDASVHIISNSIQHNHATVFGGGAIIYPSLYRQSEILNNFIFDNVSDGIFAPRADEIPAPARANGGGLVNGALVAADGLMTIANNVIFSNTVSNSFGSGLTVTDYEGVPISIFHNTIANNGSGTGFVTYGDAINFYNNIVVGFSVGITEVGTAINRDYNAWDNTTNFEGNLTAGAHDILGAVNFVDSANGDFHILPGRVAGAGTDMGITTDMDGESRPLPAGTAPDIGADEILQRNVYLPLILK